MTGIPIGDAKRVATERRCTPRGGLAMPVRIQLRRTKGWRKPAGVVCVARPTRWGNPFGVDRWQFKMPGEPLWACVALSSHAVVERFETRAEAAAKAVAMFRELMALSGQARLDMLWKWCIPEDRTTGSVEFLRGKDLGCWCPLDQPCHADVLIELANAPEDATRA